MQCYSFPATSSSQRGPRTTRSASGISKRCREGEIAKLEGHTGPVLTLALTPDGKRLVSGSEDRSVRVWDLETRKQIFESLGHTGRVHAVAVTPDGRRILSGSFDDTLRVWDAGMGRNLAIHRGHTDTINTIAVMKDGRRVLTGSDDKTIRIWDIQRGIDLGRLEIGTNIRSIAVAPGGNLLVAGVNDGSVRIWDIAARTEVERLNLHRSDVTSVAISSDGRRIATASDDDTGLVWDAWLSGPPLLERAKTMVPRCPKPDERRGAFLPSGIPAWCVEHVKWPYAPAETALQEGLKLLEQEEDEDSSLLIAHAIKLDPHLGTQAAKQQAKIYLDRGRMRLEMNQEEIANGHFAKAASYDKTIEPQVKEAQDSAVFFRGLQALKERKDAEAAKLFAAAIAREPGISGRVDREMAIEHFDRGLSHVNGTRYSDAEASFKIVLDRDKSYEPRVREAWASHYFERGRRALRETGGEARAKEAFDKALSFDKGYDKRIADAYRSQEEERARADLNRGTQALDAGKIEEAMAAFAQARAREGSTSAKAELHNSIAWRLFIRKRANRRARRCRACHCAGPQQPQLSRHARPDLLRARPQRRGVRRLRQGDRPRPGLFRNALGTRTNPRDPRQQRRRHRRLPQGHRGPRGRRLRTRVHQGCQGAAGKAGAPVARRAPLAARRLAQECRGLPYSARLAAGAEADFMGVRYFGARVDRLEDPSLLTGRGRYVDDLQVPGLLHAAFVRSPLAHARIKSIDAAAAREMPGVVAVLTLADLDPAQRMLPAIGPAGNMPQFKTTGPLAKDEVNHVGVGVAMVIADDALSGRGRSVHGRCRLRRAAGRRRLAPRARCRRAEGPRRPADQSRRHHAGRRSATPMRCSPRPRTSSRKRSAPIAAAATRWNAAA